MMNETIKASQHIDVYNVSGKSIAVMDEHQYAILFWGTAALDLGKPLTLISIDYHPDTNPPFWMMAYQKAVAIDPERADALVSPMGEAMLARIQREDLESLEAVMSRMNNDEQINTAMALGYLSDYHMLNAMEKHVYPTGHHYLIPPGKVGDLSDGMFKSAGFETAVLGQPYILDIDLDYFMEADNLKLGRDHQCFKALVQEAHSITIARSKKYFDYLRRDKTYDLEQCERDLLKVLESLLQWD